MDFRRLAILINSTNAYSSLKWPLLFLSSFITFLSMILLTTYRSHSWFTYQSFALTQTTSLSNRTTANIILLEYGSFGLWEICSGYKLDESITCTTWTRRTRPEHFHVTLVLITCVLFLSNLTIFPSWAATILVIYNVTNRYTRYIMVILWSLLVSSLVITILLIFVMSLIGITKFYSPGQFTIDHRYIRFKTSVGIVFLLLATISAILGLILIIFSLIWKNFIATRLIEEEKQLHEQLNNENYSSNWHQIIRFPRDSAISDDDFEEPPPYR